MQDDKMPKGWDERGEWRHCDAALGYSCLLTVCQEDHVFLDRSGLREKRNLRSRGTTDNGGSEDCHLQSCSAATQILWCKLTFHNVFLQ